MVVLVLKSTKVRHVLSETARADVAAPMIGIIFQSGTKIVPAMFLIVGSAILTTEY